MTYLLQPSIYLWLVFFPFVFLRDKKISRNCTGITRYLVLLSVQQKMHSMYLRQSACKITSKRLEEDWRWKCTGYWEKIGDGVSHEVYCVRLFWLGIIHMAAWLGILLCLSGIIEAKLLAFLLIGVTEIRQKTNCISIQQRIVPTYRKVLNTFSLIFRYFQVIDIHI